MMAFLFELLILTIIVFGGYLMYSFKYCKSLSKGIVSVSYLMSILLLMSVINKSSHLMAVMLIFRPIIYSHLLVLFFKNIDKKDFDWEGVLTKRELEITDLISQGLTNKEIASTLVISEMTVKKHVQNILRKTECKSRKDLIALKAPKSE